MKGFNYFSGYYIFSGGGHPHLDAGHLLCEGEGIQRDALGQAARVCQRERLGVRPSLALSGTVKKKTWRNRMNRKFFLTTKDTKKKRHGFEKLNKSKKAVQRTALQEAAATFNLSLFFRVRGFT